VQWRRMGWREDGSGRPALESSAFLGSMSHTAWTVASSACSAARKDPPLPPAPTTPTRRLSGLLTLVLSRGAPANLRPKFGSYSALLRATSSVVRYVRTRARLRLPPSVVLNLVRTSS
jgi:hypothetical protein